MITATELNPHSYNTTPEQEANLATLLFRLNRVRTEYGQPMVISSGLRSEADQARINPGAPKSKHLLGQAADIADADGKFKEWVKANLPLMEKIGLWIEAFESTPTWCHLQCVPPKSGNRVFIP